jgi:hypothetical protein
MSTVKTKNAAIKSFIANMYAQFNYDLGTVILLPEFTGNDDTGWLPDMESNGIRKGSGENDFIRLGSLELDDNLKAAARYTNNFQKTEELEDLIKMLRVKVGNKIPGKLIRIDSMAPFRRTNPELDIKWADKQANIACMVGDSYIYSQTRYVKATSKEDIIIQHTNREQISENGRTKRETSMKSTTANSDAMKTAANAKLDEMKAK